MAIGSDLTVKVMLIKTVGLNILKIISGITLMIIVTWYLTNGLLIMGNGTD